MLPTLSRLRLAENEYADATSEGVAIGVLPGIPPEQGLDPLIYAFEQGKGGPVVQVIAKKRSQSWPERRVYHIVLIGETNPNDALDLAAYIMVSLRVCNQYDQWRQHSRPVLMTQNTKYTLPLSFTCGRRFEGSPCTGLSMHEAKMVLSNDNARPYTYHEQASPVHLRERPFIAVSFDDPTVRNPKDLIPVDTALDHAFVQASKLVTDVIKAWVGNVYSVRTKRGGIVAETGWVLVDGSDWGVHRPHLTTTIGLRGTMAVFDKRSQAARTAARTGPALG